MGRTQHKIKDLGLERTVLESSVTPKELERQLRKKGITVTDDTIRRYKKSIISGIIEIDPELHVLVNKQIRENINKLVLIRDLFIDNLNIIFNERDIIEQIKTNPLLSKNCNVVVNIIDKLNRTIQTIQPSKAIDTLELERMKKKVIVFDNI